MAVIIGGVTPRAGRAAVLIAGPTASGKSRLALELARKHDGAIINTDSMQVYSELRIVSARPSPADERAAPHWLYGQVPASTRYSVGRWLEDVGTSLRQARAAGLLPIFVGGTGLYFKALTEGLATLPPVPAEIRQRIQVEAEGTETVDLHKRLAAIDAEDAELIRRSDRSRILRALEVFSTTGKSLAALKRSGGALALVDAPNVERVVLWPERAVLHARISERAERMVHEGAMAEAAALGRLDLPPNMPAMKAIGVRQLLDHMRGDTSLDEAVAAIKTESRRYAKRQMTWFRNQMADWRFVEPANEAGA
jgi:tRNA dimethylallyltransferase